MSSGILGISLLLLVISGVAYASYQFRVDYSEAARRWQASHPWEFQDVFWNNRNMSPAAFRYLNSILGKRYNSRINDTPSLSTVKNNEYPSTEEQMTDLKSPNVLYSNVQKSDMEISTSENTSISTSQEVPDSMKGVNSSIDSLNSYETTNLATNETNEGTLTNANTSETETKSTQNSILSTESLGLADLNTTNSNKSEDITDSSLATDSGSNSTISKETQWTKTTITSVSNVQSISSERTISSVDLDYSTSNASNPVIDNTSDNSIDFTSNTTKTEETQSTITQSTSTDNSNGQSSSTANSISSSESDVSSINTHTVSISETASDTNDKSSTPYFTSSSVIDVSPTNTDKVSISETSSGSTGGSILSTSGLSSSFSHIVDKTTENGRSTVDNESTPTSTTATIVLSEKHIITISSIHTIKIAVSVVFLVVALIATALLAIYMIKTKRREVQYDQLTLLP